MQIHAYVSSRQDRRWRQQEYYKTTPAHASCLSWTFTAQLYRMRSITSNTVMTLAPRRRPIYPPMSPARIKNTMIHQENHHPSYKWTRQNGCHLDHATTELNSAYKNDMVVFWYKFYRNSYPSIQITISQHRFRKQPGPPFTNMD